MGLIAGLMLVLPALAQAKTVKLPATIVDQAFTFGSGDAIACDAFAVIHFPAVRGPDGREPAGIAYTVSWLTSGSSQTEAWSPSDDDDVNVTGTIKAGAGEHVLAIGDDSARDSCAAEESELSRFSDPVVVASFAQSHTLGGRVTDESGTPVAGATVEVSGARSSRAQTDAVGDYIFALPTGQYRVAPTGSSAPNPAPPFRAVALHRDVTNANFVVSPCAAASAAGVAHVSAASCKLKVFIKPLERSRSGLAVHTQPYGLYPADFFVPGPLGSTCESGCTDVLITVIDPSTGLPAAGAIVNASVAGLASTLGGRAGSEQLCHFDQCGQHVLGVATDEKGLVLLRYWAPGLVRASHTTIKATAKLVCSAAACPVREKEGSARTTLTVSPYLIYKNFVDLSRDEAEDLAAYGGGTRFFNRFLESAVFAKSLNDAALTSFSAFEGATEQHIAALETLEKVEKIGAVAEVLKVGTEIWEREATIHLFLNALTLSPIGLDNDPVEASADGFNGFFEDDLISPHVALPFQAGANGVVYHLATFLHERQQADPRAFENTKWQLGMNIHEISFCDPGRGSCGPGYAGIPGTSVVDNPGIQPQLLLDFALKGGHDPSNRDADTAGFRYDAVAWTETQPNLQDLTPP